MEELHINLDDKAESQLTKRKQEEETEGGVVEAPSKTNCENGTDNRLRMKGKEKMTAVEQVSIGKGQLFQAIAVRLVNFFSVSPSASQQPPGATTAPDLETFFEGFGVRGETIAKVKELGFTSKAFTSNLDELPAIIASIKKHCHLTVGEEQGIKCAAKHWQKEENSPVIRVSGDDQGASSSQTEGQSQQTSTGQGFSAVPAGNTHEAPFSNQRAEMPEDAPLNHWYELPDLDIVKQYLELKLSNQHCNIPAKTISRNEVVAMNGWLPGFEVNQDSWFSQDWHIGANSDFDVDTSGERK